MKLAELRKLAAAATPRRWGARVSGKTRFVEVCLRGRGNPVATAHDAAYLVAVSPDRVLALLDAVDAGRALAERSGVGLPARKDCDACAEADGGACGGHAALAAWDGALERLEGRTT